ncbi:MAG: hypothetical protein ACNI27_07085 [Desulfovibrio sp.]
MGLLPYQKRWNNDKSEVKFWEKSRRIGASFGDAAESALVASLGEEDGGMSTYYLSYNKDMTKQYVADTALWAKKYDLAASEAEEIVIQKEDEDITIYQVRFASGFVVQGLSSNPSNLRSKKGRVRIDEGAFVDNLKELLKSAIALTMWGGDVAVISTHNGEDNYFNQCIQDIRAGKLNYSLHRTTLNDALGEGLYQTICKCKKIEWSEEAEQTWREKLYEHYGDDSDEELDCIPSKSSGSYLTRNIIENCMNPEIPVVEWVPPAADFVDWPKRQAEAETEDWCEEHLLPHLEVLPELPHFFGFDFGRTGDLSVLTPVTRREDLSVAVPFMLEMRNAPFRTQEQILFYIVDRLPQMSGGDLDARGNGQQLAEAARQRYGPDLIEEVMLSQTWYRENMPRLKTHLEDRTISIPNNSNVLDDLRGLKVVKGIAKPPEKSTQGENGQRHCDSAVSLALAVSAEHHFEVNDEWEKPVTAGANRTATMMHGY